MTRVASCGLLMAVFCLPGCTRDNATEVKEHAARVNKPVSVMTVSVAQEEVRKTSTQPATVHAFHEARIRARVPGYITTVNVDIGDVVEAGTTLAVISVPEMNEQREVLGAQIERARAEEDRAQAGIDLAVAGVAAAEALLEQSRSDLQSVEASLAAAEAEFRRTNDLVERRSLEGRMLDEARKKRDAEVARKASVKSAVTSAEADVSVAKARQASANADLKAASADTRIAERELSELTVRLRYATLKSPFAGVVTARSAEPGDLADADDGEALFVISQVDKLRVRISIPERDAAFVNRGDTVSLSFPSFAGGGSLTAAVTRSSGTLDAATRMMLVEAEVANTDGKLIPGMFGQAHIELATSAADMLPARAVRFTESGDAYVYAVVDDRVSVVPVQTGVDDGTAIEILSGVTVGQRVIDAHLHRFTDGQDVTILK